VFVPGALIQTVMKGLLRTILDNHRDVAILRHAIDTFACLLNVGNNAMTASFDDPLLNDIIRKIEELKLKANDENCKKVTT
jgi:hypothetical protein